MHEKLQKAESDGHGCGLGSPRTMHHGSPGGTVPSHVTRISNHLKPGNQNMIDQLLVKHGMILHSIHCIFPENQGKVNFKAFFTLLNLK